MKNYKLFIISLFALMVISKEYAIDTQIVSLKYCKQLKQNNSGLFAPFDIHCIPDDSEKEQGK